MRHFCHPGDWVVSLCNGTGTDNVAAMWEGVNCIGVDFSKMMFDYASKYGLCMLKVKGCDCVLSIEFLCRCKGEEGGKVPGREVQGV